MTERLDQLPRGNPAPRRSRRRVACRNAALVCLALLAFAFGTTSATASGSLTWDAPLLVDHQSPFGSINPVNGISCPSATFCAAVDGDGNVLIASNPTGGSSAWTFTLVNPPNSPGGGGGYMKAISCPSASLCVGVDSSGDVVTSSNPTGGASAWTVTAIAGAGDFSAVSCASATLCVAVDSSGHAVTATNPTGGASAWHVADIDGSSNITGVSCPTATLCVATDFLLLMGGASQGDVLYSTTPSGGGVSDWHTVSNVLNHGFEGISCASATLCALVTVHGEVLTASAPTGPWTTTAIDGTFTVSGISCAPTGGATTTCAAVDDVGNETASANVSASGGTWSAPSNVDPGNDLLSVACPTSSLCAATDANGGFTTTTNPTSTTWSYALVDTRTSINGVSCPTAGLCVGVDTSGSVVTSTSPSSAWTVSHVDGTHVINGVSCASASLCVGVDNAGDVVTATNPGSGPWTVTNVDGANNVNAVSCAASNLCVAVDNVGDVITSAAPTAGAGAWTVANVDGSHNLDAVSCAPTTTVCVGVDFGGNAVWSSSPTGGAGMWHGGSIDGTSIVSGISCASAAACVAVDDQGDVITTTSPTGGSGGWTTTNVDGSSYLLGVSCLAAGLCAAVDKAGNVLTSTSASGAGSWTATSIDPSNYALGISCASPALCVAGDRFGRVIVGSAVVPPGAPTGVSAVAGNAQATVSFTPPASNGGAAITSYTVTASPGGAQASGAGSPITVTGLSNGTPYSFTVVATNSAGPGPASAASNTVTPSAGVVPPGAPTGVSAVAGNGQATVSFTPPASTGGAAITSYTVTASPGGAHASGAASPITVTGLTNGTPYTFTVVAANSAGPGPASAASAPVTPSAPSGGGGGGGGNGTDSISVSVSPGSQSVAVGGAASFTVTLTNTGSNTLSQATLSDASAPACNRTSGSLSALGSVAPSANITYTCSQPSVAASFTNTVVGSAIGAAGETVTASAAASVTAASPPPPVGSPKAPSFATLTVSGLGTVLLSAKPPILAVTLTVSKSTTVVLELLDSSRHKLAVWTEHLTKGKHPLKLVVPLKGRKPGHARLRLTETGNSKPKSFPANLRI